MNAAQVAERVERSRVSREAAFARMKDSPQVKLMISLIPPSSVPEALDTLLRAAFEEGASHGAGDVAVGLMEAILTPRKGAEGS